MGGVGGGGGGGGGVSFENETFCIVQPMGIHGTL